MHTQTRFKADVRDPCGGPWYEELAGDGEDLQQLVALEEVWQGHKVSGSERRYRRHL
jgi:hypothetical protein